MERKVIEGLLWEKKPGSQSERAVWMYTDEVRPYARRVERRGEWEEVEMEAKVNGHNILLRCSPEANLGFEWADL